LIGSEDVRKIWSGPKPALFITDFLRTDWRKDPPNLPPNPGPPLVLKEPGQRRVYANEAAWRLLKKR
jgi:hypothetical protein